MMNDTPFRPLPARIASFLTSGSASGTDNVVSFEQAHADTSPETFPACIKLLQYWQSLSGTRQMPLRQEFDPREIEMSLPCTFVAEKVTPSVARIRVSGSVLNDALGMEVRGMPITALFDPCARDALAEATQDVFEGPSLAVLELTARQGFKLKPLHARMILLPMSDTFGKISRLVGCLDIQGDLGKTPRRFQINAMRHTKLSGDSPVTRAEDYPVTPILRPQAPIPSNAFAEDAAAFAHSSKTAKASSHARQSIRLVVNND